MIFTTWRTSSRSGSQSNCVEVGTSTDGRYIGVRDSKHRAGGVLVCTRAEWAAFLAVTRADALPMR